MKTNWALPIKHADDCIPCPDCGEPYCPECEEHYAECAHPGPTQDEDWNEDDTDEQC